MECDRELDRCSTLVVGRVDGDSLVDELGVGNVDPQAVSIAEDCAAIGDPFDLSHHPVDLDLITNRERGAGGHEDARREPSTNGLATIPPITDRAMMMNVNQPTFAPSTVSAQATKTPRARSWASLIPASKAAATARR